MLNYKIIVLAIEHRVLFSVKKANIYKTDYEKNYCIKPAFNS